MHDWLNGANEGLLISRDDLIFLLLSVAICSFDLGLVVEYWPIVDDSVHFNCCNSIIYAVWLLFSSCCCHQLPQPHHYNLPLCLVACGQTAYFHFSLWEQSCIARMPFHFLCGTTTKKNVKGVWSNETVA